MRLNVNPQRWQRERAAVMPWTVTVDGVTVYAGRRCSEAFRLLADHPSCLILRYGRQVWPPADELF